MGVEGAEVWAQLQPSPLNRMDHKKDYQIPKNSLKKWTKSNFSAQWGQPYTNQNSPTKAPHPWIGEDDSNIFCSKLNWIVNWIHWEILNKTYLPNKKTNVTPISVRLEPIAENTITNVMQFRSSKASQNCMRKLKFLKKKTIYIRLIHFPSSGGYCTRTKGTKT